MLTQRNIIIIVGATALIVLLYLLITRKSAMEINLAPVGTETALPKVENPGGGQKNIATLAGLSPDQLKDSLRLLDNKEKKANFAHHLSAYYRSIEQFDSSAYYSGLAANSFPNEENLLKAGTEYFNAYGIAVDEDAARRLSKKSSEYLNGVLDVSPEDEDAKIMLALLSIATGNASAGARILQEVLAINPDNADALYNLGVVALQSGNYAASAQYFERIIQLDSVQVKAYFYLALCYKEMGRTNEAILLFEKVKELDSSPEVHADVDAYLDEIK